jgi:type IV secretory pathway VirB10-like protein
MTEQSWLERHGATPSKLAVVGILAVVLVAVVWHNIRATTAPAEARETRPKTPAVQAVAKRESKQPAPSKRERAADVPRIWPKFTLEKVTKYDPLAKPMWYLMAHASESGSQGASLARSAQVLEELKKQPTKIVVISGDERIATIGELSFRVGDTIEGFQVTEITTEGIVLTEIGR